MWLAIEGIIGAGKTTTTDLLGETGRFGALLERSDKHPFIDAYYSDPQRHAVETELAFMLIQVHQLRERSTDMDLATDFSPPKNLIFARLALSGEDLEFVRSVDAYLWRDFALPDLTVFLDVPIETCLRRIGLRGRSYERDLQATYLKRLRDGYLQALDELGRQTVRLELEGDEAPAEVARMVLECSDRAR